MENFSILFYNSGMKKIIITILFLVIGLSPTYALSFNSKTQEQTPADPISQQAKVFYAQNDIDKALEILNGKSEDSRSAEDWMIMGNILQDKNKIDETIYMYNQSINTDPKYYKAHYNLGYIYLIQEKPNMALVEFKKSVKYKPDFSYGYYNIGCAYLKLKNYGSAKYNFFKALDLKANNPDIYYNLAYSYKMMNKEKQANTYLDLYNKMMEDHEF